VQAHGTGAIGKKYEINNKRMGKGEMTNSWKINEKGGGHTESRKSERDYDTRCYFNVRSKADIDNRHCLLLEPMRTDVDFVTRPFDLDISAQVKRDVTTFIPISGSLELFFVVVRHGTYRRTDGQSATLPVREKTRAS